MSPILSADVTFTKCDEKLQRAWHASRKVSLKCMKLTLSKYYTISDALKFQQELLNDVTANKLNPKKLYPDQNQILFGNKINGTNIEELDSTIMLKLLRTKLKAKNPVLKRLEKLQEIRNRLAHYGTQPLSDHDYKNIFKDLKSCSKHFGTTDNEIDYWLTANLDISDQENHQITHELLRQIRDANKEPVSDIVLQASLDIVSQEINQQWVGLASGLNIKTNAIQQLQLTTNEEYMRKCFDEIGCNISWIELKRQLQKLNRGDIIKRIKDETDITIALKEMANHMRNYWTHFFEKTERTNSLVTRSTSKYIPLDDAYVTLSVVDASEIESNETISDHEFNITKFHKSFINPHGVFDDDYRLVLVRGISGIGKSFFIERFTLEWCRQVFLKDIKCFLVLFGRELSNLNELQTFEDLLLREITKLNCEITMMELLELTEKIVIILDGFDELSNEDRQKISELLQSRGASQFYILVTSRPDPLINLYRNIKNKTKPKLVDVLGFTQENKDVFLDTYYKDHPQKEEKLRSFKRMMAHSEELKALTTVPAYLETLCCLNNDLEDSDLPDTRTGLFLLAVIATIQRNNKKLKLREYSLLEICDHDGILSIVRCLADLSYQSLLKRDIMMLPEKFTGPGVEKLENSGLIFKCHSVRGEAYQFRHLLFTEVLAGLHLFLQGKSGVQSFQSLDPSSLLWNTLATVIALHRISKDENTTILSKFIYALTKPRQKFLSNVFKRTGKICNLNVEITEALNKLTENAVKFDTNDILYEDMVLPLVTINASGTILLEAVYEMQTEPPMLLTRTIEKCRRLNVTIKHHHNIKFIANLFEYINAEKLIDQLDICLIDDVLSDKELLLLQNVLVRAKWIRTWSMFNSQLFFSCVTSVEDESPTDGTHDKNGKFKNLQNFSIFPEPSITLYMEEYKILISRLFELKEISFSTHHITVEYIDYFSRCLKTSKVENHLQTEMLTLHSCFGVKLDAMMDCLPFIEKVIFINSCITVENAQNLSLQIIEAARNQINNNKALWFEHCNLTLDHLVGLSPCFRFIKVLFLYNNPYGNELVKYIIWFITDQLIKNEIPTLKILGFSHLDLSLLYEIIPILNYLKEIRLRASTITSEWLTEVKTFVHTNISMVLDNDLENKNEILEYFQDTTIRIKFQTFLNDL